MTVTVTVTVRARLPITVGSGKPPTVRRLGDESASSDKVQSHGHGDSKIHWQSGTAGVTVTLAASEPSRCQLAVTVPGTVTDRDCDWKPPAPAPGLTRSLPLSYDPAALRNSLNNSPCPLGRARGRGLYNLPARAINNKSFQCSDGRDSPQLRRSAARVEQGDT